MENFGCRASQADGDAIAAGLDQLGLVPASSLPQAEVVIVNTCTVTAEADRDARAYIRRVQRANASARIVVTGCYAQRAPQEIAGLPGVSAVIGNSHKHQVAPIAAHNLSTAGNFVPLTAVEPLLPRTLAAGSTHLHPVVFAHSDFADLAHPASSSDASPWLTALLGHQAGRTRPNLKIQDGCGNRCTFCVIPTTRGNSRSLPRPAILHAVQQFASDGGKELVLSGINLGRWGRDLPTPDRFTDLVAAILQSTPLPRLRISSVEPMDWSEDLIALLAQYGHGPHPRLARHAHLPLQSGSDAVLRRMHRRYRPWHYAAKLAALHAAQPQAAIGADVMVGFPGESDAEFQESYDFIAAQPLTYLHLFPFSARPGTPAWNLHRDHPVPALAVQERMAALRALIEQKNLHFRSKFIGKPMSAVTLIPTKEISDRQCVNGLTDNFISIEIASNLQPNTLVRVQVTGLTAHGLSGNRLSDKIADEMRSIA
ncbi:MAG TPA: tRNA (N(6)-L-threonylcarbamoyladenosine(37)-C(2))-methylthiotransferase MtaB [Acidobacteriaceae bacterium]|nr:tRNA (N(6)-L-threonylcarbamoyladenosine(37)-C(2))-methylthiotransferase MtaB [Acidobacteriaceae bacterium]